MFCRCYFSLPLRTHRGGGLKEGIRKEGRKEGKPPESGRPRRKNPSHREIAYIPRGVRPQKRGCPWGCRVSAQNTLSRGSAGPRSALTLEVGKPPTEVTRAPELPVSSLRRRFASSLRRRALAELILERAVLDDRGANMVCRTKERACDLLSVPGLPALVTQSTCWLLRSASACKRHPGAASMQLHAPRLCAPLPAALPEPQSSPSQPHSRRVMAEHV